ncbi:hypothetical protein [Roseomonas mucosa]|uniref:hypothetical protein n=1 Tax=Roseomonas mucosa TaxID=207340 RepID=UPI0037C537A9
MTMPNPAQDFLDQEVALDLRPLFPAALKRAYATANRLIRDVPALATTGGRLQRGDLIAAAAEYEVEKLVTTGQLPFDCSWEPYARPTGLHLVVYTSAARLTINQVEDPRHKPRSAVFRENYGLANKPYLFDYMNEEELRRTGRKHLLLIHGYQDLNFAHLAVPHGTRNHHIAKTPNLLLMPHIVSESVPDAEGPTDTPELEAIEHLTRIIRDHNDE